MSDGTVGRPDGIAGNLARTPEIRITIRREARLLLRPDHVICEPPVAGTPVGRPAIVLEQIDFVLPGDGFVSLGIRAVTHLIASEMYRKHLPLDARQAQNVRNQQDRLAGQPFAGIHHGVAHDPIPAVEQEIFDTADVSVRGPNMVVA